jgi:hypothetical protein
MSDAELSGLIWPTRACNATPRANAGAEKVESKVRPLAECRRDPSSSAFHISATVTYAIVLLQIQLYRSAQSEDHPSKDQGHEGHDYAPVRRVESDRRLDGRQVVVEAARVDSKKLGKESESIASEGLDGHWVIGKRQPGDGETDRGREDLMTGNGNKYHRM